MDLEEKIRRKPIVEMKIRNPFVVEDSVCMICRKPFKKTKPRQVTCGDFCAKIHRREYGKEYRSKPENKEKQKLYMREYRKGYNASPAEIEYQRDYMKHYMRKRRANGSTIQT